MLCSRSSGAIKENSNRRWRYAFRKEKGGKEMAVHSLTPRSTAPQSRSCGQCRSCVHALNNNVLLTKLHPLVRPLLHILPDRRLPFFELLPIHPRVCLRQSILEPRTEKPDCVKPLRLQ